MYHLAGDNTHIRNDGVPKKFEKFEWFEQGMDTWSDGYVSFTRNDYYSQANLKKATQKVQSWDMPIRGIVSSLSKTPMGAQDGDEARTASAHDPHQQTESA